MKSDKREEKVLYLLLLFHQLHLTLRKRSSGRSRATTEDPMHSRDHPNYLKKEIKVQHSFVFFFFFLWISRPSMMRTNWLRLFLANVSSKNFGNSSIKINKISTLQKDARKEREGKERREKLQEKQRQEKERKQRVPMAAWVSFGTFVLPSLT